MRRMMRQLWNDDKGALIATEWVFIVTILVIGLVVGLKSVQKAVVNELEEIASAIGSVSQSYSFGGTSGCCSFSNGSFYTDHGANSFTANTCFEGFDPSTTSCAD